MQRDRDTIDGTAARRAPLELGVDEVRRERQHVLLQEWRRALGEAGYDTLVSVSPPLGILVRDQNIDHRWLSIATSGLLVVFERSELGRVCSEYHMLAKETAASAGPSARAVLAAVSRHLSEG